ncbi:MAG: hypothetical protein ACTH1Z_00610 [Ancrocorticia sp.]|uniref:hypothetical protein n=1 Tax=Ancrocorticia sp. TaxID=2593684 RepID=UPI003F9011B5
MKRLNALSRNARLTLRILVSALLVAGVVWTGLMATSPQFGKREYAGGSMESSVNHYSTFLRVTPDSWEGWEGPFNRGTARIGVGIGAGRASSVGEQYTDVEDAAAVESGVGDLEAALERVPEAERSGDRVVDPEGRPECTVRRNLSLGYELQGDVLLGEAAGDGAGSGAGGDSDGGGSAGDDDDNVEAAEAREAAIELYTKAQETIAPCTDWTENQEQWDRQEEKKQEQQQENGGGTDDPPKPPPPDDPEPEPEDPETQQKQDELDERNQRGQQEHEQGQQEGGSGGGVNW